MMPEREFVTDNEIIDIYIIDIVKHGNDIID